MKKIIKRIVACICALTLMAGSLAVLSSVSNVEAATEDVNKTVYLPGFRNVTTSSFYSGTTQMPDSVTVDGGDDLATTESVEKYPTMKDMQGTSIANYHKTLLSLKVDFEKDTSGSGTRLEVAGSGESAGFRLYLDKDYADNVIKLRLQTLTGVQTDVGAFRFTSDTVEDWTKEFNLQMSFEYGDFDNNPDDSEANDVKVGVYINGELATAKYLVGEKAEIVDNHVCFYDCDTTKLGTYMKVYTVKGYGDLKVSALVPENPNLTNVTWSDFKLAGTETVATDKVFTPDDGRQTYILNKTGIAKFENTSFEAKIKFGSSYTSSSSVDEIYFAGTDQWRGLRLYPTGGGQLALIPHVLSDISFGFEGGNKLFAPTIALGADVTTFIDKEFTLKITTEYADYFDGDGVDDVQLGFWFDGKLYNNQYCYVKDYKNSTNIGNCLVVNASKNSVSIKSVLDGDLTEANVTGVYTGSSNGQVKLALAAGDSMVLPTAATYANVAVNISDGVTTADYAVEGTLADGILTLNLADKMIAGVTNTITVKQGTYSGVREDQKVYLKLAEDFVCYQDKLSGEVYQKIGTTTLGEGLNFNANANNGQLYLVGADDLTTALQGFNNEAYKIKLIPLNDESGVFRKSIGKEEVKMTTTECEVYYPANANNQYYFLVGDNKAEGDIFTIKGQFKVVEKNAPTSYKGYQNVIEFNEVKYQYLNSQWNAYTEPQGPWTAEAEVTGVYKGSSNGMVKVVLSALNDTTLPAEGTCTDVAVTVSDGTTNTDYTVAGTVAGNILSLNLADKITPNATNTITIKAGTYSGVTGHQTLSLKLTEDFICCQDQSSGVVYQKLGSVQLTEGTNFNVNAAKGQLYLEGADITSALQGFAEADRWRTTLIPLNNESGVFRKTDGGENVQMTTAECTIYYPANSNAEYYVNVGDNKADGDTFTIKGQFKVVKGGDTYKDYQNVIEVEEVTYQYKNGLWKKIDANAPTPDPNFKKITFSHFNMKDKVYTNSGKDEFQAEGKAKISLNKTLFCGEIQLESDGNYDIRFGGKDSTWHGLRISATQYGSWHVYWIGSDGKSITEAPLVSMNKNGAGTPLFGTMLDFMLSTEIVAADDDGIENDIKFGFWFDNTLYNNEYLIVKDRADELGSRFGIMAKGEGTSFELRSIPELVEEVNPEDIVVLNEDFKKITFAHFGIEDGTYNYVEKNFSVFGKAQFALDRTVFSGDIFIPEGTDFSFQYGGKEHAWYGLMFNIEPRGAIHISWHDEPNSNKYLVTEISSSKAQTPIFGKWVNLKISTEIIDADKDGQKDDIRFGVWFNDIPYNEEYLIVYDKAANLGSYFGLVGSAKDSSLQVRSIAELVEPFSYETYGLTKDWEKVLLNTGLTSEIPVGGSRESGPYSGDASNIAIPLIVLTISIGGLALCLLSKKRYRQ